MSGGLRTNFFGDSSSLAEIAGRGSSSAGKSGLRSNLVLANDLCAVESESSDDSESTASRLATSRRISVFIRSAGRSGKEAGQWSATGRSPRITRIQIGYDLVGKRDRKNRASSSIQRPRRSWCASMLLVVLATKPRPRLFRRFVAARMDDRMGFRQSLPDRDKEASAA